LHFKTLGVGMERRKAPTNKYNLTQKNRERRGNRHCWEV